VARALGRSVARVTVPAVVGEGSLSHETIGSGEAMRPA
jgi:hypothetical protein